MKKKFDFIYKTVTDNMKKLDNRKITIDQAKAMAVLAKQANNVIVTQLDVAKFMSKSPKNINQLKDVGLAS